MLLKMKALNGTKGPRRIVSAGMLFLAAAVSSLKFLHPSPALGPSLVDALQGFLFGIAIGLTLMGLILMSRQRRATS